MRAAATVVGLAAALDLSGELDTGEARQFEMTIGYWPASTRYFYNREKLGIVLDFIFDDGISTSDGVSELSGRGVGLAAVRAVVQGLGGGITVVSAPGAGTRFIIQIPNRDGLSAEAA